MFLFFCSNSQASIPDSVIRPTHLIHHRMEVEAVVLSEIHKLVLHSVDRLLLQMHFLVHCHRVDLLVVMMVILATIKSDNSAQIIKDNFRDQTMTMAVVMVTIQLFPVILVLIIQFSLKFHKRHSTASNNHYLAIMPMLRLNVKCSMCVH